MAQIKKFNEYFEQPQPKKEVEEASSAKTIDIAYLANMDVEKSMDSMYAKISKDLTKSFKGKEVSFEGSNSGAGRKAMFQGKIEEIQVMHYDDSLSYTVITLDDGVSYSNIKEITIL